MTTSFLPFQPDLFSEWIVRCFAYAFIVVALASCMTDKNESADERPNILFFLIDDQRNDQMACAGHPFVQTPTVDKLAREGVRFTNAFVTTSICAASRASIFTGTYEYLHNHTFGKPPIRTELVTSSYPYLLRKSGYNTGFVGKFGVKLEQQDSLLPEMFDFYRLSPINSPYYDSLPDGTRVHSMEVKGRQAIEYLNGLNGEQPFCLSISFNAVHAADANKRPGREGHYPYPAFADELYQDIEMPLPRLNDPAIYEQHPEFLKQSLNRERFFWRWDTEEKYDTNLRAYYRMLSGYDQIMADVLKVLEEKDFADNTVVIYTADNGYYMGNRGFAGKWTHYEESLRVPMIVFDPRMDKANRGQLVDHMALNIDVPRTILSLANVTAPQHYHGSSLVPLMDGSLSGKWRTDFFIEHRMDHPQLPKYRGMRNERYVYANYYEQEPAYEYLHDLQTDPDQLTNLATDPSQADLLAQMREQSLATEAKLGR